VSTPSVRVNPPWLARLRCLLLRPARRGLLTPASVAAFGPGGIADGENSLYAALAVGGHPANPWYSYVSDTPVAPGPTPGTGLLLDMGRTVTVTSVRVAMNGDRGGALQLRAGAKPLLSCCPDRQRVRRRVQPCAWRQRVRRQCIRRQGHAAAAAPRPGAGPLRPYLVHQLPPDLAGTYQASVYQVTVLASRSTVPHICGTVMA